MNKIVIFNVGGALSSFGTVNDKNFVIDLGSSAQFYPVSDFLVPLFEKRGVDRAEYSGKRKYKIDQLFLSHLDNDHISNYNLFRDNFYVDYMTSPNDNFQQLDRFKINRKYLGVLGEAQTLVLKDMAIRTTSNPYTPLMSTENPLVSVIDGVSLFYIHPGVCENESILNCNYANNISLVLFIKVNNRTVLFPGDILKNGMKFLIESDAKFKSLLESEGVDYLIAPHHGLQTSFSKVLFDTMKGNRTRLNIISEKIRTIDSNERRSNVDTRYYLPEYSTGFNSLHQRAIKTSGGHILIDFDTAETTIKKYVNIEDVIREFCH